MKRVIVITGTPGVGKSLVSAELASRINAYVISLGNLVREEKLYTSVNMERDTLVVNLERVSRRVMEMISSTPRDVIVEGHFAVDVVPSEEASIVFVFRRDPEELKRVLESRSYKETKVAENLAAELLDVCLYDAVRKYGVDKVCEIDVTSKSVDEVVQEILDVLNGLRERRIGIVDWLEKLESEGKLEEYLRGF
ncbi:MAG: adenylate kinase family protein [Candidatus Bathyarchaeia archaeon]